LLVSQNEKRDVGTALTGEKDMRLNAFLYKRLL